MFANSREIYDSDKLDSFTNYYKTKAQLVILRDLINVIGYDIINIRDGYNDDNRGSCFIGAGLDIVNNGRKTKRQNV